FYDTKATHATTLTFDKAGNLIVGTGMPGRVLRIDAEGKGFVLLDSPYDEVRTLKFDDKGTLYVAALSGRAPSVTSGGGFGDITPAPPAADSGRPLTPSVSVEVTSISILDGSGGSTSSTPSSRES